MKAIVQFLQSLPEPARWRAFTNVDRKVNLYQKVENMEEAIGRSFRFDDLDDTPEGFKYWYDVFTEADKEYHQKQHASS
ncbi:MAG TPA: hypothetical protein VHA56_16315 [Mucilaginibacter sp.]|nr:hypothetical protein [Mucilaginibacter sp.]